MQRLCRAGDVRTWGRNRTRGGAADRCFGLRRQRAFAGPRGDRLAALPGPRREPLGRRPSLARRRGRSQRPRLARAGARGDGRGLLPRPLDGARGRRGLLRTRSRRGSKLRSASPGRPGSSAPSISAGSGPTTTKASTSPRAARWKICSKRRGLSSSALRASMIVGAGSASFGTLVRLVSRLPVLAMPDWRDRSTQPIAIADVVACLSGRETSRPASTRSPGRTR